MDFVLVNNKRREELAAIAANLLPAVLDEDLQERLCTGDIVLQMPTFNRVVRNAVRLAALIVDESWRVEAERARRESKECVDAANAAAAELIDGDRIGGPGARAS